jgi:hypothetical protein
MRIPGLELLRLIEFHVDAATASHTCEELSSKSNLPSDISIVRFEPALMAAVAAAHAEKTAVEFGSFYAAGESGWVALDGSGRVIGHCWRLDNRGDCPVKRTVTVPVGFSWFHYEWTVPTLRGKGIMPSLLCKSIYDSLQQPGWVPQGFITDVAVTNRASQRSSAKGGFVPVSEVTILRIYRRWFLLRSEPVGDAVTRETST